MRAARLAGPGQIVMEETALPEPGAGEVRIRLEGCGVCASNLTPWAGAEWMQYPLEPGAMGHEGWGVVDALGDGVSGVQVGDRVAALSYKSYAEYDVAAADAIVPLPSVLDGKPFPGEPLGCAMNIFRRSGISAGQTVAIVGIGFLGALLTRLASDAGARVIAISRRPFSLDVAKEMGAHELIPMDDHWRIIERVKELTGGTFADRVIEAVGKQWPLDLAAEITRSAGGWWWPAITRTGRARSTCSSGTGAGWTSSTPTSATRRCTSTASAPPWTRSPAGGLDPSSLYTHGYALDELGRALDDTRDRPDGFLKALVSM
jgi:threonine dehydrogenase-like Zn-dependent dehydrogenase